MQPLPHLLEGLKILEPYLFEHGFTLDNFENGKGSGGQFTNATYTKDKRKFIIGYRYSIGVTSYQYSSSIVTHDFYLDNLGFADKKMFPDFQSDDYLQSFRHILHDFTFLEHDFFVGDCKELKRIAVLQEKYYQELQKQLHLAEEQKNNRLIIEKARQYFKAKNYKACMDTYKTLSKNYTLTDFDKKTLALCKQHP